jgi:hypothetical protein
MELKAKIESYKLRCVVKGNIYNFNLSDIIADVDFHGYKGINLGTPTNDSDAATKGYVDDTYLIVNAESVGDGASIIKEILNKDLKLKSLKTAPGLTLSDEGDDLRVVIERIDGGTFI